MTPTETQDHAANETALTPAADEHTHDHSHEGHDHHHHHAAPPLNPELVRTIQVEAPVEEVDKAFAQVTKKFAKQARIPGFRAGKVPVSMIKSRFKQEVRQEVLDTLVNEKFRAALLGQKLQPLSQPQVTEMFLIEGAPLKFTASFEVLPEISVDGYDTVKATRPESALTDDEYEGELNNVLEHHAVVETVEEERALVNGDWAEIGFKGVIKDLATVVGEEEKGEEISGEDVTIEVGGKNTLPAFNAALLGSKVGQELTFEADYPAEFGDARLAGKTVAYDVTVKAIKKKTFPERNEELAKQLGPYSDWNDFETKLRERAQNRKKQSVEAGARDIMVEELIAKFQFPVPETFVQQQIDARLERGLRALAQQGMTADAMRQLDFERLRAAQRDEAVNEVKASLILDRIADRENIVVNEEDLERELLMLSLQQREPLDTMRKRLTEDGTIDRIRESMRRERTGQALFEKLAS